MSDPTFSDIDPKINWLWSELPLIDDIYKTTHIEIEIRWFIPISITLYSKPSKTECEITANVYNHRIGYKIRGYIRTWIKPYSETPYLFFEYSFQALISELYHHIISLHVFNINFILYKLYNINEFGMLLRRTPLYYI